MSLHERDYLSLMLLMKVESIATGSEPAKPSIVLCIAQDEVLFVRVIDPSVSFDLFELIEEPVSLILIFE